MNPEQVQSEVDEWLQQQPWSLENQLQPILGVIEEMGELVESSGGKDAMDSIGDTYIYLCDHCIRHDISISDARSTPPEYVDRSTEDAPIAILGRLAHATLKQDQGIRLEEDEVGEEAQLKYIGNVIHMLENTATVHDTTLDECVDLAWYGEVKQRDWNEE